MQLIFPADCLRGWEQEFFVIDAALYRKRPDLVNTGRTSAQATGFRGFAISCFKQKVQVHRVLPFVPCVSAIRTL